MQKSPIYVQCAYEAEVYLLIFNSHISLLFTVLSNKDMNKRWAVREKPDNEDVIKLADGT